MISKKEIEHLAKLAHLYLDQKEIKRYQKEISEILDYVSQLKRAKVDEVIKQEAGMFGSFRPDEVWSEKIASLEELLNNAPLKEKNFIKTKSVFAKSKKTIKRSTKIL